MKNFKLTLLTLLPLLLTSCSNNIDFKEIYYKNHKDEINSKNEVNIDTYYGAYSDFERTNEYYAMTISIKDKGCIGEIVEYEIKNYNFKFASPCDEIQICYLEKFYTLYEFYEANYLTDEGLIDLYKKSQS